jgi:hypothetical protein
LTDPTAPSATPAFLNHDRPPVPDLVVPRGVQPFHLHLRPVRGRLVRLNHRVLLRRVVPFQITGECRGYIAFWIKCPA